MVKITFWAAAGRISTANFFAWSEAANFDVPSLF